MATTKKKLERGPMGRAKKAPADDGGARNVDAGFVRAMEMAAVGTLAAAAVCFGQASASCPPGPRRDALRCYSKIALMFSASAKTLDDDDAIGRVAKLAAELEDRVFGPCGEEAAK